MIALRSDHCYCDKPWETNQRTQHVVMLDQVEEGKSPMREDKTSDSHREKSERVSKRGKPWLISRLRKHRKYLLSLI